MERRDEPEADGWNSYLAIHHNSLINSVNSARLGILFRTDGSAFQLQRVAKPPTKRNVGRSYMSPRKRQTILGSSGVYKEIAPFEATSKAKLKSVLETVRAENIARENGDEEKSNGAGKSSNQSFLSTSSKVKDLSTLNLPRSKVAHRMKESKETPQTKKAHLWDQESEIVLAPNKFANLRKLRPLIINEAADQRSFEPGMIVFSKMYIGKGAYEWRRYIAIDRRQGQYLIQLSSDNNSVPSQISKAQKWVSWTNIWIPAFESLEDFNERVVSVHENTVDNFRSLLVDPTVDVIFEENTAFLRKIIHFIHWDLIYRLVFRAKQQGLAFRCNCDQNSQCHDSSMIEKPCKPPPNSSSTWRSLLEDVGECYKKVQVSLAVKNAIQAPLQPQRVKASAIVNTGKVKEYIEVFERRGIRFQREGIEGLLLLRLSCDHIEKNVDLFQNIHRHERAMNIETFKKLQSENLKRALEKLHSTWVVEIYHILREQVVGRGVFQSQRKVEKFIRLFDFIVQNTISIVLKRSIENFHDTFHRNSPLISLVARLELKTRLEQMTEEGGNSLLQETDSVEDWLDQDIQQKLSESELLTLQSSSHGIEQGGLQFGIAISETETNPMFLDLKDEEDEDFVNLADQETFDFSIHPPFQEVIASIEGIYEGFVGSVKLFPDVRSLLFDDFEGSEYREIHPPEDCLEAGYDAIQNAKATLLANTHKPETFCHDFIQEVEIKQATQDPLSRATILYQESEKLPIIVSSGLFQLELTSLRTDIQYKADDVRMNYLNHILSGGLQACDKIREEYEQFRNAISSGSSNLECIEEVWGELEMVRERVSYLEHRIKCSVISRFNILEQNHFMFPVDSIQNQWNTFSLPKKLWVRAETVREELESRKDDLKDSLRDQISKQQKKVNDYLRFLKVNVNFSDLERIEENAVSLGLLEENINECVAKCSDIYSRATLFGVEEEAKELERSSVELTQKIGPIVAIWTAAADIQEIHTSWFRGSILKITSKETLARIETIRAGRFYYKTEANKKVYDLMEAYVKEIKNTERLVTVFTSTGLQRTHWVAFSELARTKYFEPSLDTSVRDVLSHHGEVMEHLSELELIAKQAIVEYEIETALDEMETELRKLRKREPLPQPWELQVLADMQLTRLEVLEKHANSCENGKKQQRRIAVWRNELCELRQKALEMEEAAIDSQVLELRAIRQEEPRLCLVPDQVLLNNMRNLSVVAMMPYVFPYYGTPGHLIEQNHGKKNLLDEKDSSNDAPVETDKFTKDFEHQNTVGKDQILTFVVNDIGEHLQLQNDCIAKSFAAVECAVEGALRHELMECLQFFRSSITNSGDDKIKNRFRCVPDSSDVLLQLAERWPKQICELSLRILLSEATFDACGRKHTLNRAVSGKFQPLSSTIPSSEDIPFLQEWLEAKKADAASLMKLCKEAATNRERLRKLQHHPSQAALGITSQFNKLGLSKKIIESLLLLVKNEEEIVLEAGTQRKGISFISDSKGNVQVLVDGIEGLGYCPYGYDFVSGQTPTFIVLPSMRWHLSVTKTFYQLQQSILIHKSNCSAIVSLAAALGRYCPLIRCETAEQLECAQNWLLKNERWGIIEEYSALQNLMEFNFAECGIVVASRKMKFTDKMKQSLRPVHISINEELIHRQFLLKPKDGSVLLSSNRDIGASSKGSALAIRTEVASFASTPESSELLFEMNDSNTLELYLTRYSQWKAWERRILSFLRREGEDHWVGKPSNITVHDAQSEEELSKNPECAELLRRLQNSDRVRNVKWSFVFHSSVFIPQHGFSSDLPSEIDELTILLLREAQRPLVDYLVDIPNIEVLQEGNDVGRAFPLLIVLFEDSEELHMIEDDFPRLRRVAHRLKLEPWWLNQVELEKRTTFDDSRVIPLIASTFLSVLGIPGVRPHHYGKFVLEFRSKLPDRISSVSASIEKHSRKLEQIHSLLVNSTTVSTTQTLKTEQLHHQTAIDDLSRQLEDLPRDVLTEVAHHFSLT